ncbi:MAG: hypothetical protein ABI679_12695 [Gemmatimonadota bacterium]
MRQSCHRLPWVGAFVLVAVLTGNPLEAQSVTWRSRARFYGDNTEFFTPFRTGETILGAQFRTWLDVRPSAHTRFDAGVFGDYRFGENDFLDPVKPILSFRYETPVTTGMLGTLETVRRHGYLEPLEVTTLEFTRPVEYGGQLIQRHRRWNMDLFLDWQGLNTPSTREIFNYGVVLQGRPADFATLEFQFHGLHHGGQLFSAGVPVTNNTVNAIGLRLHHDIPLMGSTELAGFYLSSKGNIDPAHPTGRPDRGHGTYLRGQVAPGGIELFALYWAGRDFHTDEGDPNYNSVGVDDAFYRSRRRYAEFGVVRRHKIDGIVSMDAEFRLHRSDEDESQALFNSKWEYSYRLVFDVPIDVIVRH